jgi:hypothetical protein
MELVAIQFSPLSCHVLTFRPKYVSAAYLLNIVPYILKYGWVLQTDCDIIKGGQLWIFINKLKIFVSSFFSSLVLSSHLSQVNSPVGLLRALCMVKCLDVCRPWCSGCRLLMMTYL